MCSLRLTCFSLQLLRLLSEGKQLSHLQLRVFLPLPCEFSSIRLDADAYLRSRGNVGKRHLRANEGYERDSSSAASRLHIDAPWLTPEQYYAVSYWQAHHSPQACADTCQVGASQMSGGYYSPFGSHDQPASSLPLSRLPQLLAAQHKSVQGVAHDRAQPLVTGIDAHGRKALVPASAGSLVVAAVLRPEHTHSKQTKRQQYIRCLLCLHCALLLLS